MSAGVLEGPCIQRYIKWKIPNFLSLSQKADTYIQSPPFQFLSETWKLRIYPNGQRIDRSVEWVGLYVKSMRTTTSPIGKFAIGIVHSTGQLMFPENSYTDFFIRSGMWGCSRYMKRGELLRRSSEFISDDGTLQILCTGITSSSYDASVQTESIDNVDVLSKDLHSLLHNERKSDVRIKVGDEIFRAHKLILGARSPVFAAMFEHEMKEYYSGVIEIEDCEPDIFHSFLGFIYTGYMEKLTLDNVAGLFSLADKYDLQDLKGRCVIYMKENLNLETVYDVLSVADKHNEEELKNTAKDLLAKNIKEVMASKKWLLFISENPVLATEILKIFIPDNNDLGFL